jgi:predicted lipoprotein with Yx(FWY)xxD motif
MNARITVLVAAALLCAGASAFAAKPCEELKSEIAAKLDAKNVTGYTLDIVEADKVGDAKVVGSCEGGARKIVYAKKK